MLSFALAFSLFMIYDDPHADVPRHFGHATRCDCFNGLVKTVDYRLYDPSTCFPAFSVRSYWSRSYSEPFENLNSCMSQRGRIDFIRHWHFGNRFISNFVSPFRFNYINTYEYLVCQLSDLTMLHIDSINCIKFYKKRKYTHSDFTWW